MNLLNVTLTGLPEWVLIDTWWNVNSPAYVRSVASTSVLIDTWWNVNLSIVSSSSTTSLVLIDTWWNVNATGTDSNKNLSGFNRYMVECEYGTYYAGVPALRGFNRYMVECESRNGKKVYDSYYVLIDTWWNVNVREIERNLIRYGVLIDTWWNVND